MKSIDLPNDVYTFVTDSQELECITAYLGITEYADEITGALVKVGDGDYDSVYLTDASKPWDVNCEWYDTEYFADSIPEELDLQDVRDED